MDCKREGEERGPWRLPHEQRLTAPPVRHPYNCILILACVPSKTSLGHQLAVLEGKGFGTTGKTFTALALKIFCASNKQPPIRLGGFNWVKGIIPF